MRIPNPTARFGEDIAANFLVKKGYKIIDRNFRKGYGEVDIIATYKDVLIFVEVKTRTTNLYGGAIESISYHKIRSLIKSANFYKHTHPNLPNALRIDAILIDVDSQKDTSVVHLENISGF